MHDPLTVRWSLGPLPAPRPWRHCRHCETLRPFVSSGRFRVNAQKKRLDAWLIYRCDHCAASWNLPLVERQAVQTLERGLLARLTANDAALARAVASDRALLRRHCHRVEPGEGPAIVKERLGGPQDAPALRILLAVPPACPWRLDRLLAAGLGLPRGAVPHLAAAGLLRLVPDARRRLARPPLDGQEAWLALAAMDEASCRQIRAAAF